MNFNVAKCHSMRVTRHLPSNQIHFNFSLHQQTLEQVEFAKYLGITINDNLEWGQRVSEISSKATKTLGFLQRNLALAPQHIYLHILSRSISDHHLRCWVGAKF